MSEKMNRRKRLEEQDGPQEQARQAQTPQMNGEAAGILRQLAAEQQNMADPQQQLAMPAGAAMGSNPAMGATEAVQRPRKVTAETIQQATHILQRYKAGKARLDQRLIANELWWEQRGWQLMQEQGSMLDAKRPTQWLFNVIMGKHADMVEGYPEPTILPREEGDQQEAKMLTSILPVVLEQNDFAQVYSDLSWEKNKNGTGALGVFWDPDKLNGLGDITIMPIDLINLFWEPGINDVQKSQHLFYCRLVDKDALKRQYPQLEGKALESGITIGRYQYDESIDVSDKALVVDWYYHTWEGARKKLQYCKFVSGEVLYASEDDPAMDGSGWYADGDYPFIIDPLFPRKGTIAGTGYIDLGRNAQEEIDLLSHACVLNAMAGSIPRSFVSDEANINEQEYADFTKPFIHVQGQIDERYIQPIQTRPLSSVYVGILNNKIEELKQISGNQDVTNGSASGVTAASGIAALQEAAGRSSRDGIKGTYRAYARMITMVIERIRQFYDAPRKFRILGEDMQYQYVSYSNQGLTAQPAGMELGMDMGLRLPVFDVEVAAQKQNAYSKMSQNELAMQLLSAGVFNLGMVDQSLMLLDMMDFPRKERIVQKLQQGQTMMQMMAMYQQVALTLAQKYEPELAQQLAGAVMQDQGGGMAAQATQTPVDESGQTKENTRVANARERAAQVSQPS